MSRLVLNRDGGKTDEFGHMLGLSRMTTGEVIEGLTVVQQVAPNMSVLVQPGSAKIQFGSGGGRYDYWVVNDSDASVTLPTADTSNPRIDIILAVVDRSVTPDPLVTNNSNNMFKFVVASGTPATIASDPTSGQMQAAAGVGNPYIRLARIYVDANRTQITNTQIVADLRTFVYTNRATVDWTPAPGAATVTSNNGQKEHVINVGADVTGIWSPGTKLRIPRAVVPSSQSSQLVSSSSQYASKTSPTGITFTNNFTCEAWIYLDSYPVGSGGSDGAIIGRTDSANGFQLCVEPTGQIRIHGIASGSTNKLGVSYQSVPLSRWVHVAATLDVLNNVSNIYIDGALVPSLFDNAGNNITNAIVQAGDIRIGKTAIGGAYFNGKISNARVWSAIRTAQQIRDNMNQAITTTTTNLVANYPLNGSWNDLSGNNNTLTPSGGAINNFSSNPFNATEYAIVTYVGAYSSGNTPVTVFTGQSNSIPNESIGQVFYSTSRAPFGFPSRSGNWSIEVISNTNHNISIGSASVYYPIGPTITVPVGSWTVDYDGTFKSGGTSGASQNSYWLLSRRTAAFTSVPRTADEIPYTRNMFTYPASVYQQGYLRASNSESFETQTTLQMFVCVNSAGGTYSAAIAAAEGQFKLTAKCSYI